MKKMFRNALVYRAGEIHKTNAVFDGSDFTFSDNIAVFESEITEIYNNCLILPGFCDVHVHFREPGFLYKEDIASGTAAAARGGYTAVCTMPNLSPAPDSAENLEVQLEAIRKKAKIAVIPYGTITKGQRGDKLSDMTDMADKVAGFSDDGRGVQNSAVMREAMLEARRLGKIIAAHCEDDSLIFGGYIHDGEYAKKHSHKGISSESEWAQIARDLALAREAGCSYHVCHISAKESVELIRRAKAEGVDVTCETAPHYLVFSDNDLKEDGRFRMNPPIRSAEDRAALIRGIRDGTVDMIATDHAPHSAEEKSGGLEKSLFGVVGLETAFAVLYTDLVLKNVISLEKLVRIMSDVPRARFGLSHDAGYSVWETGLSEKVDISGFASKGKSTPFAESTVNCRCLMTVYGGKVVYRSEKQ